MELQWELMVFTLFMCLGAGLFAAQGILAIAKKGAKVQMPALVASLVSVIIGGIGSFLHLEHWERIFNGFGNLTSGITQELIGIVVFVVVLVIYFALIRRSEEGIPPVWAGVLAVVVSIALVIVMAHSYNVASRPAWDTPLLWLYYLCNAALLGSVALACIAGFKDDEAAFSLKLAFFGSIANVIGTAAYGVYFAFVSSSFTSVGNYFDNVHPTKAMVDPSGLLFGEAALPFWVGAVLIGALIPLVLAFIARKREAKKSVAFSAISLICGLAGGMCFRVTLYLFGLSVFMFY